MEIIQNKELTLQVSSLGAELISINNHNTGEEYLWQANPAFWKRHSPVLFPIVGSLWNGEYMHKGIRYAMGQHGFARDKEFTLIHSHPTEVCYLLESTPQTFAIYPFPFRLKITYTVNGKQIKVLWEVENTGDSEMYFQIGAHPAFNYKNASVDNDCKGYFGFTTHKTLEYLLVKEKGCVKPQDYHSLSLENELLPITSTLFDQDALIFENSQISKIDLLTPDKEIYIRMHFEAPLVGLWSPAGNAPFVCIEPWYGRCDRVNYTGEFKDRDWMNHLAPSETFSTSYFIEIV